MNGSPPSVIFLSGSFAIISAKYQLRPIENFVKSTGWYEPPDGSGLKSAGRTISSANQWDGSFVARTNWFSALEPRAGVM